MAFTRNINREPRPARFGVDTSGVTGVAEGLQGLSTLVDVGLETRDQLMVADVQRDINRLSSDFEDGDVAEIQTAETELGKLAEMRRQGLANTTTFQARAMGIINDAAARNPRISNELSQIGRRLGVAGLGSATSEDPFTKALNDEIEATEKLRLQAGVSFDDAAKIRQNQLSMAQMKEAAQTQKALIDLSNAEMSVKQEQYGSLSGNIAEGLLSSSFEGLETFFEGPTGRTVEVSGSGVEFAAKISQQLGQATTAAQQAQVVISAKNSLASAKLRFADMLSDEQASSGGLMTPATKEAMQETADAYFKTIETQLDLMNPKAFNDAFINLASSNSNASVANFLVSSGDPLLASMIPTLSEGGLIGVMKDYGELSKTLETLKKQPGVAALIAGGGGKDAALFRAMKDTGSLAGFDVGGVNSFYATGDVQELPIPYALMDQRTVRNTVLDAVTDKRTDEEVDADIAKVGGSRDANPVLEIPSQQEKKTNVIGAMIREGRVRPLTLDPKTISAIKRDPAVQTAATRTFQTETTAYVEEVIEPFTGDATLTEGVINIDFPEDYNFIEVRRDVSGGRFGAKVVRSRAPVPVFKSTVETSRKVGRGRRLTQRRTVKDTNSRFDHMIMLMSQFMDKPTLEQYLVDNFAEAVQRTGVKVVINGREVGGAEVQSEE